MCHSRGLRWPSPRSSNQGRRRHHGAWLMPALCSLSELKLTLSLRQRPDARFTASQYWLVCCLELISKPVPFSPLLRSHVEISFEHMLPRPHSLGKGVCGSPNRTSGRTPLRSISVPPHLSAALTPTQHGATSTCAMFPTTGPLERPQPASTTPQVKLMLTPIPSSPTKLS